MSSSLVSLASALACGIALGLFFFCGLWWTVHMGATSRQPALWLFGSLLMRMSIALVGIYYVAGSDWERMLCCLSGFVIGRVIVVRITRLTSPYRAHPPQESGYAP